MKSKLRALMTKLLEPVLPVLFFLKYKKLCKDLDKCFLEKVDVFFFFPAYHIGGAEKIHLQILLTLQDKKVATFITNKSQTSALKDQFINASDYFIDFNKIGNYIFFQRKLINRLSKKFNNLKYKCTVFGCNSFIFYDIIDEIQNPLIRKIDLLHAFSPYLHGIEKRAVFSVMNLNKRIIINKKTKEDLQHQYQEYNVNKIELNKLINIYNPFTYKCHNERKNFILPLNCLWVGRGSKEKRPWIFARIAERSFEKKLPLRFSMIGNVSSLIPTPLKQYIVFYGEIESETKMQSLYFQHDLLLTTSIYEGFPLTIVEAICNNVVNLSTNVGGISEHITHKKNGFLIDDSERSEEEIINSFIEAMENILNNPTVLAEIRKNAVDYVRATFSMQKFKERYREILINE